MFSTIFFKYIYKEISDMDQRLRTLFTNLGSVVKLDLSFTQQNIPLIFLFLGGSSLYYIYTGGRLGEEELLLLPFLSMGIGHVFSTNIMVGLYLLWVYWLLLCITYMACKNYLLEFGKLTIEFFQQYRDVEITYHAYNPACSWLSQALWLVTITLIVSLFLLVLCTLLRDTEYKNLWFLKTIG